MTDLEALETFGRNIRTLRKILGLNQTSFAEIAEIDRNTLGQIERGERKLVGLPYLLHIARVLKVPPAELLKGCE